MEMAIESTEEGLSIGGETPRRFITGYSNCLRLPLRKAKNIVAACVATRVRQRVLNAAASLRQENDVKAFLESEAIDNLLKAIPIGRTAELEAVSQTIEDHLTANEREKVLEIYANSTQRNGEDAVREVLRLPS